MWFWLQDDAHIFCLPSQIEREILGVLDLTEQLLSQFGFQDFEVSSVGMPAQDAQALMASQHNINMRRPLMAPRCQVNLSTRPDKFVGSEAIWGQAEQALKAALQRKVWHVAPPPPLLLGAWAQGLLAGGTGRVPSLTLPWRFLLLLAKGWAYEEDVGGGAFYGPKIDIKICDALGRKWQCSTVQVRGAGAGFC